MGLGGEGMAVLPLASRLWLREPDAKTIDQAHEELGLPLAETDELAQAFTDLFVLNVFPYGSVFLDPNGELNGPSTETLSEMFANADFDPPELREIAAPDHLALCLEFLGLRRDPSDGYDWSWIHACCIAVQREPGVHPFYFELASRTAEASPQSPIHNRQSKIDSPLALRDDKDEVTLGRIVRFFLSPARCGMFLSRGRLGHIARNLDMRLPFGSRFEVARSLFQATGEGDRLNELLQMLEHEVEAWESVSRGRWITRLEAARSTIQQMRAIA